MKTISLLFASLFYSLISFSQPTLIKDINPGSGGSLPNVDNAVRQVGNLIFFAASSAEFGAELWKTDGSGAGTQLVKDIKPGSNGSGLNNFYAFHDSLLLFTADDGVNGVELWRSDGTDAGTFMVKNIGLGPANGIANQVNNPIYYIVFNGELYFGADDGSNGNELWKSNGTEAGTILVKDIYTGSTGSFPASFEALNGTLFFAAKSSAQGKELWKTDGTQNGTQLIKDINPGVFSSNPSSLRSLGNVVIFIADDDIHDSELWLTDGSTAGTMLVKDIKTNSIGTFGTSGFETQPNSFENRFARIGDIAFFSAIDDSTGIELWKTDGTPSGTVRVKDASNATGSNGFAPQNFTKLGSEIYYKFDDDITGTELWKSDGSESGTHIVKDLEVGSFGSFVLPTYIYAHNDKLYFGTSAGFIGNELYESDGTETGTHLLADINPGFSGSTPNRFISLGSKLIFWAAGANTGMEPWIFLEPISLNSVTLDVECFGDSTGSISIQISPNATSPYSTVWNPDWVSGLEPANLPAGTYSITVTDANGQTATSIVTIDQPTVLNATSNTTAETGLNANGTATAIASGGVPPYTFLWNTTPPQTTQSADNLSAGTYECTITDVNGCSVVVEATVLQVSTSEDVFRANPKLKINPNPACTQVSWAISGAEIISGTLTDIRGSMVKNLSLNEISAGKMDSHQLSDGIYCLKLITKNGKSVSGVFIVEQ